MLGTRLWQRVPINMPNQDEFREIISGTYPILDQFLPGIIDVYDRLYALSTKPSFASISRASLGRPISPRDLLKWCRRLANVLATSGSKTGAEPITESTRYEMFLEATDCFAGSLQTEEARRSIVSAIAEEMHVDPQSMEHFLTAHIPRYDDGENELVIGRVRLPKRRAARVAKPSQRRRPFANTTHAKRLLEQVGVAVSMAEPILLVGETGIGKTTVVQQLADSLGFKLTAVNLSQQSEVGDLLGGFKPVNVRSLAIPLKDEFDDLFNATGISVTKNQKYIDQLSKCIAKSQWTKASKLWREAPKMFEKIVSELSKKEEANTRPISEQPTKRRKTESRLESLLKLKPRWSRFSQSLDQFDIQLSAGSKGFAFTFVEGNIVKAARNGEWVLLDEINLASPDTLESIADLLHGGTGSPSILLSETGEIERIQAHPDFRIFGAMNPATDIGKRDLPMGLRSRFTELYVQSPDRNLDDLLAVIKAYLKGTSSNDDRAAHDVARLYMNTKRLAEEKRLVDGANEVPHFSLRTLTRVLSYVTEIAPSYGLRRALYEGFAMGFLTLLDRESENMLMPLIEHHLLDSHGNPQALLAQTPRHPEDGKQYVRFLNKKRDRQYWMLQGFEPPQEQSHYIITPFVERNMLNLVRATSTRRFPVLIQGPTSSGKTSMIEYLAKFSGNKFVRINNHEHTDLQEYLGTYVSDSVGRLHFQEGLLVQALRQGHWIVLDELNLAPTDVLEALNRLLDDNRELLIPETQEVVRPHDNFMLFATQNPAGLYGGRKTLSRAFRNRFLELHFDDIPEDELDFILEKRSQKVAPSDCRRIVAVYKELSRLRQSTRLFEQKDSFATLRDLFRWALRDADNREQLAANGYMLLAERVRNVEERAAVKGIIEKVMKVKIDVNELYNSNLPEIKAYDSTRNAQDVVWTQAMRRLYVLVAHALRNNEPVLLVGETGCGKTTVCQMLAEAFKKELHIVNAHQNTETGDLIGAQRPIRNRSAILDQLREDLLQALSRLDMERYSSESIETLLSTYLSLPERNAMEIPNELRSRIETNQIKAKALFEWSDGSLVQAMKDGQFFLLDEISLADDSVLERLNSVLESHRAILLAEKGIDNSFVTAADGFQFFATMNPGGDYGKRELSPALRNRFTEIWVPALSDHDDVIHIVESKLSPSLKRFSEPIVQFAEWFGETYRSSSSTSISVRDILAWIKFMNGCAGSDLYYAAVHGASMVYIDTLGANPAALLALSPETIHEERAKCLEKLGTFLNYDASSIYFRPVDIKNQKSQLAIGEFSISKLTGASSDTGFAFDAPTTKMNAMRVLRAFQVQKPILIEGSPGVGKTTLISALARATNRPLTRINLSEQTDLMDLFGSDVPVEGAEAGHFAWRDAPFLQAMQRGEWVLLDEMNLASQSVLEGLNACLDHRGEVYISELDQTFKKHPNFSVFAAQNPHHQGGGRKGLPSSFVNRFTVVYADVFRDDDLKLICQHNFPTMSHELITTIINFVSRLELEIVHRRNFGSQGGPWEFNLRDILRWLHLLNSELPFLHGRDPSDYLNLVFRQRFRTNKDREELDMIFSEIFGVAVPFRHFFHNMSSSAYQVGIAYMERDMLLQSSKFPGVDMINRLPEIESVMMCIQQNLPCILVGPSGSGKSTILEHIAAASGKNLTIFPLNTDIDTMDLVGGFEQVDPQRSASGFLQELVDFLRSRVLNVLPNHVPEDAIELLELLENHDKISSALFQTIAKHLQSLQKITSMPEFGELASTCEVLAGRPMALENARFEWVDGVLIKALEQGKWLVLDNANLCSASVLDRLNSLLEPNGFLSINEHCGPDGEPKVIKPHPDFRIFLTMDPRFGELSRAMRNRAVEIYVEPLDNAHFDARNDASFTQPETSLQRYRQVTKFLGLGDSVLSLQDHVLSIALDNLAWSDFPLLSRFCETAARDLSQDAELATHFTRLSRQYSQVYQAEDYLHFRKAFGDMMNGAAEKTLLPAGFGDAQILHPLQNTPLVPLLEYSTSPAQVYWLAACLELKLQIAAALEAHKQQETAVTGLKPSQMNRLQRSIVSDRVASVATDSTVKASPFLLHTLKLLNTHLNTSINRLDNWEFRKEIVSALMRYWWNTFDLVTNHCFEETFQAHLSIGSAMIAKLSSRCPWDDENNSIIKDFSSGLLTCFASGFTLTTGLSMEVLWKQLRPLVTPDLKVLQIIEKLESLAVQFDSLKWNATISVAEIGGVMMSLVKAYRLVLSSGVDGDSLVTTLKTELDNLRNCIAEDESNAFPFFHKQFEALRQFSALSSMRLGQKAFEMVDTDTVVLANYSSASQMRSSICSPTSWLLQNVDYLWSPDQGVQAITDKFAMDILHQIDVIAEVDLKSLRLLEAELPILAERVSKSTESVSRDPIKDLGQILTTFIDGIVNMHEYDCRSTYRSSLEALTSRLDFNGVTMENFYERVLAARVECGDTWANLEGDINGDLDIAFLANIAGEAYSNVRLQFSALSWVHFATGCIRLYVPNKAFDPDKRQRLERQRHGELTSELHARLDALKFFERLFSSQESNLRCQIIETEIMGVGDPPQELQEIYRPEVSELNKLQGEFKNLLNVVLISSSITSNIHKYFTTGDGQILQDVKLIQNNLTQIIKRLSERFQAYRDLTVPVISMLRCLQIGLHMATLVPTSDLAKNATIVDLSKATPFLGGERTIDDRNFFTAQPMEYLELVSTIATIETLESFDAQRRQNIFETIHSCYEQWTKKLEFDRTEAEAKSGLYRFRGSAEDEDKIDQEQFNELFPSYDDDEQITLTSKSSPNNTRDIALHLARVHSDIFLGRPDSSDSIISLIRFMSASVGKSNSHDLTSGDQTTTRHFLSGSLLLLNDQIEALSSSTTVPDDYNFYTDANLPESRSLVSLIHHIQARFKELQAVDEIGHMQPLEDVIVSCRELLRFRHTEPLAKIITKVEKVHGFMHEWQFGGWASRANSALALYDKLTSTIVSWRRLELATWSRLFDMENKKCDDDARSWWFVAYQVVIAAPLSISESADELKSYAQKLLQDLESYFSTAIFGQYLQRLQLLKQLEKHLRLLQLDYPAMSIISGALANFITLYSRYEKPVQESMKKGRISLEKAMRDVLLLASWKDTNIVALRDSAKRSHHKLFKIVRKYRALLGQPMDSIVKQGLPDDIIPQNENANLNAVIHIPMVDQSALALCASTIPNWSKKPKRFINVSQTINMMVDMSQLPAKAVQGSSYLESFLEDILSSSAELQKATPSMLTEDNKDTVKHLKSRKRKLFADTLKDLRQMGIKYNLGVNALSKQESLSIVLTNTEFLTLGTPDVEYYFHKAVDLAPRAREASRQHSEDLSGAEVARSTGFLEGLLQLLLSQRNFLSNITNHSMKLASALAMGKALWCPTTYEISNSSLISDHDKVLRWMPRILGAAKELVGIHSKLGKLDAKDICDSISSWQDIFVDLAGRWSAMATLPPGITSSERQELERAIVDATEHLSVEVSNFIEQRRDLDFILSQILIWTKINSSVSELSFGVTISELDQKLTTVCNSILAATEKYQKSFVDFPTSTEDQGWFMKHDNNLAASIKALHCENITEQLTQAFDVLRHLDLTDTQTSRSAGALFAVALPIIQQYQNTLKISISRYAELHRSTCKTSYILAKIFTQIASQGFCTPSEKSDAQDGKTEKLEGGTGLGDGEGAEDISKDIQDDEDLDELAQEPNKNEKGDIEDEEDAVDMADGEMEGEMGDVEEKGDNEEGSGDEEKDGDEMDEEAGDVDDLDPTAVDEKMWDGDNEKAEKDQEGDDSKGKASKDEQVAAQENDKEAGEGEDGDEEEEMAGAEQSEEVQQQDDVEKHDPHADEGETLDLPENMQLDGEEEEGSDGSEGSVDGMDDLPDMEEEAKEIDEVANDGKDEPDAENADGQEDQNVGDEMDIVDLNEEQNDDTNEGNKTEEAGEDAEAETDEPETEDQGLLRDQNDEATADTDNAVPSDVQGVGEDQDENEADKNADSSSKAQRDAGGKGGESSENKKEAVEDVEKGRQATGDAPQDAQDDTQNSSDAQPFKKLGDALEKWHRQQTQIREAAEQKEPSQDQNADLSGESKEFQHLQDEDAEADTQALGTATEEQAHALDESMAVDAETQDMPEAFQPDEVENDTNEKDNVMDLEEDSPEPQENSNAYEGRAGATVHQAKNDMDEDMDNTHAHADADLESDVEEVDTKLDNTHLDPTSIVSMRSAADARAQWTHYESLTRPLSLSLTEQLRLILAPTLATKMRGDFRTGKRLNIKRIIPYIASSFKRDKIWMRRSIPSKRSYQIMLAVDDSKSMGESGSGSLAMETLVMISRSLAMLEVGEICVVGFGENVKVAHEFDMPFSSESGPAVFENFGFEQPRTDITRLVRESIDLFRTARQKASSSPADLWQIGLIISDGVCSSSEHDPIRRLLREAEEERILMVFVIVDDVRTKKKGESVLDLKEAKFVKNEMTGRNEVKIERYLDTFPFRYYVVVGDVGELPGVLAGVLRQWFGEVVGSG
ncbi:AAA ATPase midasin [Clarireedia jacksonii]